MKTRLFSAIALSLTLSCASTPPAKMTNSDSASSKATRTAHISGETPNAEYEPNVIRSVTEQDPEGDIAPMISCKEGEIERRQSGKIVCVRPDKDRSGSTMSGR